MKKLNNKGFTLVELLTVMVILIAILTIAIPSISASLSRSESKQLEAQKKSIAAVALINIKKKDFSTTGGVNYDAFNNAVCFLSVDDLISKKYITEDLAKNKKEFISGCVGYDSNGDFKFFEDDKKYSIRNSSGAKINGYPCDKGCVLSE